MWKCSRCGTENDDSYDYCIVCGVEKNAPPLQSSSQAQQSQAQTHEEAKENESKENLQPKAEEIQANSSATSVTQESPPKKKMLRFAVIQSPNPELIGRVQELDLEIFGIISIGRNPENLLQFADPSISRRHAIIEFKDNKLLLRDMQSTNGTYIFKNGYFEKIDSETEIKVGDVIKFGEGTIIRLIE